MSEENDQAAKCNKNFINMIRVKKKSFNKKNILTDIRKVNVMHHKTKKW